MTRKKPAPKVRVERVGDFVMLDDRALRATDIAKVRVEDYERSKQVRVEGYNYRGMALWVITTSEPEPLVRRILEAASAKKKES